MFAHTTRPHSTRSREKEEKRTRNNRLRYYSTLISRRECELWSFLLRFSCARAPVSRVFRPRTRVSSAISGFPVSPARIITILLESTGHRWRLLVSRRVVIIATILTASVISRNVRTSRATISNRHRDFLSRSKILNEKECSPVERPRQQMRSPRVRNSNSERAIAYECE